MPSHLTRHVFRRILANEPIIHRGCLRRQNYATVRHVNRTPQRPAAHNGVQLQQRRMFFDFSSFGRKRETKDPDIAPGIEKMMELEKRQRMRARMPPPEDVVEALKMFFSHLDKRKRSLEDTQAQLTLQSLRYCLEQGIVVADPQRDDSAKDAPSYLTHRNLRYMIKGVRRTPSPTDSHVALAKLLYEIADRSSSTYSRFSSNYALVHILGMTGRAREARQIVLHFESAKRSRAATAQSSDAGDSVAFDEDPDTGGTTLASLDTERRILELWTAVLWAFAREDSEAELLKTLKMLQSRPGDPSHQNVCSAMLTFYLRGRNADAVKTWFTRLWGIESIDGTAKAPEFRAATVRDVLQWCLQHQELEFGHQVVRQALSEDPSKPVWDAVFVWAAGTGKGADEIDRMMSVMEATNDSIADETQWNLPDIATINALVEFATLRNDPYLAERFIAVGKARDIHPDARTYVLQMDYRLKINDVDGALIAYKSLQSMDLSSNEDVPAVNRLIVALCKSNRHDFDTIMNVVADLSDRRVRFEPQTASALALLHLNRDEVHDVVDLLNTHAYHYSSADRQSIRDDLVTYCLDPKTPIPRAWDAYMVLRKIFDEMPRSPRTDIMVDMFRRGRYDMAVQVFNGMREHSRDDTIPTIDTYVAAFLGAAKVRDLDCMEVLHNQLKLDYHINANTYLLNSLMIGFTACGKARRALTFWDDIVASKEGPTYNSIHIALRACEKAPFGDVQAQKIWAKLRKMNVDLDQAMWASYAGALAGNGDNEKVISTVEQAEESNELEVDAYLVGSMFAAAPGQSKQAEIEDWCKERYSHLWEELEKLGVDEDENGMRSFKIDRSLTP